MRIPPLSVYLSWPAANYADPVTRGEAVLTVNIIFVTFVVIAVTGRFYSRIFIKQWLGIDDWMIIPAFVSAA